MKKRIWELDCLRGLSLAVMIGIHFIYDLVDLYAVVDWQLPQWYLLFKNNFGAVFLVISGISATLGHRCIRRGLTVFACGFLCTGVTLGMYLLGLAGGDIIIWFGVLHCLGTCMLLWSGLRRLPTPALAVLGIALAAAGLYLRRFSPEVPAVLIPLGFAPGWFASSDYFPLMPHLGFFLLGAVLGRRVYAHAGSRFPRVNARRQPIRLLCAMGEHSLTIYLLHQPILAAVVWLLSIIKGVLS